MVFLLPWRITCIIRDSSALIVDAVVANVNCLHPRFPSLPFGLPPSELPQRAAKVDSSTEPDIVNSMQVHVISMQPPLRLLAFHLKMFTAVE